MSPEQADGQPVDARSDIFSLGAILYELLAGRRAFGGESTARILSAVLRDEPEPLAAPTALVQVVNRCLAKDPARRFQTMTAVKAALQEAGTMPLTAPPSVAVLPFASSGTDKENEYFADGLTEEIINALAHVAGLKVIARTSVFAFKGRNDDIRRIAEALGVSTVLEGSVRRSGDRLRVTVQLISAADGTHLWTERYERAMTDVFAIQDEISQSIAAALKVQLGAEPANPRRHTPRIRAYEPFLRGRHHLIRCSPESWQRAKALFEEAIAEDPHYAEPHAELALGHFIAGMHGMGSFPSAAPLVRKEVARALSLNPDDRRSRVLLGGVDLASDYNWKAAEDHFTAGMAAPDVQPEARWVYASLYSAASAGSKSPPLKWRVLSNRIRSMRCGVPSGRRTSSMPGGRSRH